MCRNRMRFDFGWKFSRGDFPEASRPDFDDSAWRTLDLPHDWSIEGPFDPDSPSGQSLAYLPGGVGWYRKTFRLSPEDKGKKVFIDFDGVYRFTDVWINGHHLGFFPDGYTGFQYDLTPHVTEGDNVIAVRVDNSQQPNSRWYSGSGIYRHTWLTTTSRGYIEKDSAYIRTPNVGKEETSVYTLVNVKNDYDTAKAFTVTMDILDADGQVVASHWDARIADPGQSIRFELTHWIPNPRMWDIDDPYLYTARFRVYDGEETTDDALIDVLDVNFGVRTIEFHHDNGFLLNGRRVKIKGVALHHEAGLLGAAVPDKVWEYRLKKLREMGANAIRTAHAPMSPEFMDLCDRLGLLVFDEVFDEWQLSWEKNYSKTRAGIGKALDTRYGSHQYFDEWGTRILAAIVRRDRNHPSVIMWGIGNEIFEQNESFGHLIARKLTEVCHIEDPSRPVAAANERIRSGLPGRAATKEFLEATDLIGYNYANRWETTYRRYYAEDKLTNPQWKVFGSENANIYGIRGVYRLDGRSEVRWERPYFMNMLEIEDQWKFTNLYDYVAGDFIWTGIDYLGEAAWPRIGSASGMLDTSCFEKDAYYFFASQWSDKPILKLIPHWNWEGMEGTPIPVVCYTNCDEVELFVNGQSYGVQAYDYFRLGQTKDYENWHTPIRRVTTNDLHLLWMVPYQPGEIRAVGKKNGQIYEEVVATCGEAASLTLTSDRTTLKADGTDVAHVVVKLFDANGHFARLSNAKLNFGIEGAGDILCVNSGNPYSHEIGMRARTFHAFNGLCLVYVQAGKKPGKIRLTVGGEGIAPQTIELDAEG